MTASPPTPSTALAVVAHSDALAMVQTPTEAEEHLRALQDFVRRNMVDGEDYGVIPGTEKSGGKDGDGNQRPPKKVLLKPGAEKLAEIYGFAITYEDARPPMERWDDDPFFAYFKRAIVTRRSDERFLGSGIGSCNSREKKYAARWVFDREVPPGMDMSRLPQKQGIGKNNKPYTMYRVPNPEIYDLVNTIEKMACKRAGVSAVISVTRSAGIFTQDIEDNPAAFGVKPSKPEATEAEYEEDGGRSGRADTPSPPPVSPQVLTARRRWSDPDDGGGPETEQALAGSPDANDRALVFAWRIGGADTEDALAPIIRDLAAELHPGLKADMMRRVEERRGEIGRAGNGGGREQGDPAAGVFRRPVRRILWAAPHARLPHPGPRRADRRVVHRACRGVGPRGQQHERFLPATAPRRASGGLPRLGRQTPRWGVRCPEHKTTDCGCPGSESDRWREYPVRPQPPAPSAPPQGAEPPDPPGCVWRGLDEDREPIAIVQSDDGLRHRAMWWDAGDHRNPGVWSLAADRQFIGSIFVAAVLSERARADAAERVATLHDAAANRLSAASGVLAADREHWETRAREAEVRACQAEAALAAMVAGVEAVMRQTRGGGP